MNSNDQYRQALSQGMTPCEAEQEVAEAEEYERISGQVESKYPADSTLYFPHPNAEQTGLLLVGKQARDEFMRFTCSCGSAVSFALNKIPEVDTPMPCGNPNHWAVRFLP